MYRIGKIVPGEGKEKREWRHDGERRKQEKQRAVIEPLLTDSQTTKKTKNPPRGAYFEKGVRRVEDGAETLI